MSRAVTKIILHCSDSDWGDAAEIDKWHKARGWEGIGYHYVIVGGKIQSGRYDRQTDGWIQKGRPIDSQGAHCKGHNEDSIGVCLIGKRHFTPEQLLTALPVVLGSLLKEYNLTVEDIYGHYELTDSGKTCPNIEMGRYRRVLKGLGL